MCGVVCMWYVCTRARGRASRSGLCVAIAEQRTNHAPASTRGTRRAHTAPDKRAAPDGHVSPDKACTIGPLATGHLVINPDPMC